MKKTIVVLIVLVVIMSQSGYAAEVEVQQDMIGRYQIAASVPAIKIDTVTGKSWILGGVIGKSGWDWMELATSGLPAPNPIQEMIEERNKETQQ